MRCEDCIHRHICAHKEDYEKDVNEIEGRKNHSEMAYAEICCRAYKEEVPLPRQGPRFA